MNCTFLEMEAMPNPAVKRDAQKSGAPLTSSLECVAILWKSSNGHEMESQSVVLPDEAVDAINNGDAIEAIKIVREKTGLGLKEAKDAVDVFREGNSASIKRKENAQIPLKAVALLEIGNLIEAIRETRQSTGLGLKDSKQLVKAYLVENPSIRERFKAVNDGEKSMLILILASFAVFLELFMRV